MSGSALGSVLPCQAGRVSHPLPKIDDPEEAAFQQLFGPWAPLDPAGVADLFDGYQAPWWIAAGWALEAFNDLHRRHEDIDVAIFRRDVPRLREHLAATHHCWAIGEGRLAPLREDAPQLPDWADQVWIREHAWAPWLVDVVATPDADGDWVFKRDRDFTAPLPQVTWSDDGIRYLNPEIVLAYKAKLDRPKDLADLAATLPKLERPARAWLRETVQRLHPEHRWLAQLE